MGFQCNMWKIWRHVAISQDGLWVISSIRSKSKHETRNCSHTHSAFVYIRKECDGRRHDVTISCTSFVEVVAWGMCLSLSISRVFQFL